MIRYTLSRIFLMIPTLLGIMFINFIVVQGAPGGPIEQIIAKLRGDETDLGYRFGNEAGSSLTEQPLQREGEDVDPAFIQELEKQFGFDRPIGERFLRMIKNYVTFDFGKSYFRDESVLSLILSRLPVSISLGIWTTLFVYLLSLPLGIVKAIRNNSLLDMGSSFFIIVAYAIPSFLLGLFLTILFASGTYWSFFPLRGLVSEQWHSFGFLHKISDYVWHMTLPVVAMTVGGLAKLTLLVKNFFLEEIHKHYVTTARAKGVGNVRLFQKHIFRNAILGIVSGFPIAFLHIFFTASVLIEVLFSLDGLGLLGFEAALSRDYPVMFGTLYIFTLSGMIMHLVGDLLYRWVDPRIDLSVSKW